MEQAGDIKSSTDAETNKTEHNYKLVKLLYFITTLQMDKCMSVCAALASPSLLSLLCLCLKIPLEFKDRR